MGRDKSRITFQTCLEYAGARAAFFVASWLPLPIAVFMGRLIILVVSLVQKRNRSFVAKQMRRCFGDQYSDAQYKQLSWDCLCHFGTFMAEFSRLPTLSAQTIDQHVEWGDIPGRLREVLAEGKGLLMASGHIGNWEVCALAPVLKGFMRGVVARPIDNPLIDRWVNNMRESLGVAVWPKAGAVRPILRTLRQGQGVGILIDQDAGQDGIFSPFLGIEASTIPSVTDIALKTGTPIVTLVMHRAAQPMKFVFRMGRIHRPNADAPVQAERKRLLDEVNDDLSALVSREPSQWFWVHRRWKTRPALSKSSCVSSP